MEDYLVDLYAWISSTDPTFEEREPYEEWKKKIGKDQKYQEELYGWISSVDSTFEEREPFNLWADKVKKKDDSQLTSPDQPLESDTPMVQDPGSSDISQEEIDAALEGDLETIIGQVPDEFGGGDVTQFEAGRRRRGQQSAIDKSDRDMAAENRRRRDEGLPPIATGEKDTMLERTLGKNEVTDFFGDLWRAGAKGFETGNTVDEALELSLKGASASKEDIADFVRVNEQLSATGPSDEMKAFNKAYSAAGGGAWGFIKGIMAAPTSITEIAVTSVAQMVNPAVAAGAGTGAVTGGLAGSTGFSAGPLGVFTTAGGAIAGALGGAGATLEAGLSFSEFLQEELSERGLEFNEKNVGKILQDEDAMFNIRTKSAGRGATIGIIDAFTGGIASKIFKGVGKTAIKAGKTAKRANLEALGASTVVEGLGGGVGEATARGLVGQEMDAAEIGFEMVGGAPGSAITMLRNVAGRGKYTMGPDNAPVTFEQMVKIIEETDDATFAGMKLKIKGDQVLKGMAEDRKDKLKQKKAKMEQLGEDLDGLSAEDAEAAIELETELDKVSGGLTRAKKNRKKEIESQLDEIYSRRQEPAVEAVVEVTEAEVFNEINRRAEEQGRSGDITTSEEIESVRQELLKQKQDAIQESSTTEVDVQEQTQDGTAVGERDATGGVAVESESQAEVSPEATQEEIEQGAGDLENLLAGLTDSPVNLGDGTRGRNVTEAAEETSVEVVSDIDEAGDPVMAPAQPGVEVSENLTVVDQTETDSHYGSENFRRENPNETPQQHEEMLMERVDKALKSVKRLFPKLKIVMHRSEASYKDNVSTNSRGAFNPNTNTIHINMPKATGRTIGHEVFHAILKDRFGSEVNIQAATKDLIKSLREGINKSTNLTPEQVLELERYAQIFDGDKAIVQDEEFLAEFVGFLSETYSKLEVPQQTAIKQWLAKIAQIFGFSPQEVLAQADRDVVDLLNTIAEKVSEGQEITETDVAMLGTEEKVQGERDAQFTEEQILEPKAKAVLQKAKDFVSKLKEKRITLSQIRKKFGLNYKEGGQVLDQLEDDGVVETFDGAPGRKIVDKPAPVRKPTPARESAPAPQVESKPVVSDTAIDPKNVVQYNSNDKPGAADAEQAARTSPSLQGKNINDLVGQKFTFEITPSHEVLREDMGEKKFMEVMVQELPGTKWGVGFTVLKGDYLGGDYKSVSNNEHFSRFIKKLNEAHTVNAGMGGIIPQNIASAINALQKNDPNFYDYGKKPGTGKESFAPSKALTNLNAGPAGMLIKLVESDGVKTQAVTEIEGGQKVSEPASALKTQAISPGAQESAKYASSIQKSLKFASESSIPNKLNFKQALQERFDKEVYPIIKEKYGVKDNRSNSDQGLKEYLLDAYLNETLTAIEAYPDALGWYDSRITGAMSLIEKLHPEIATDKNAESTFKIGLAITSNGNKVYDNFVEANRQYEYFKENGKFDDSYSIGDQRAGILSTLAFTNKALEVMSMSELTTFLTTKFRAGDLKYIKDGKNTPLLPSFAVDEEVYGAAIFGPKIGNGFFMNLYGEFNQLTMDRWFMRQFGRLTGTLLDYSQKKVDAGNKRLTRATKSLGKRNLSKLSEIIPGWESMSEGEFSNKIQKASMDLKKRAVFKSNPKLDEVRRAGNNLSKQLSAEVEAPRNSSQRKFINEVFTELQEKLKSDYDIDITIADLQAVNWYPEKGLYQTFKADQSAKSGKVETSDNEQPDYESAAKKLILSRGITQKEINQDEARRNKQLKRDVSNRESIEKRANELTKDYIQTSEVNKLRKKIISVKEEATAKDLDQSAIKTQAIVENTTEEVNRLKGLDKKPDDGATLNIDGTQYTGGGLVVPAATKNTTQSELTPQMIEKFVKDNEGKIGTDGIVKVGLYKFPKSDQVSIDLNIVVPAKNEKAALEFGRLAGQESLFSLDTFENIKTGATGANPISFTDAQFRQIAKDLKANKVPKVFDGDIKTQIFNKNMTVEDIIKFGRENNFSDAMIKDYLVRIKKEKVKEVNKMMAIDADMFRQMPVSFGNIEGGARVGVKLFARVEKFMEKLNAKNNKRKEKNRLSVQELGDQTIEFLEKQPEYIAESGKRKQETDQQTQMIIDMQKALGINSTKGMNTRVREMRQKMMERRRGGMDLQAVKRDLRNFIRQALPTIKGSTYSKSELMNLLGKVTKADKKNISNLMDEVVDIVTKRQVKALDSKIESILNGKYEVVQSGRLKGVKIDNETRKRLAAIKEVVTDEAATADDIVKSNESLNEMFNALAEKVDQTDQDRNDMVDLMIVMSINNSKLMDDTNVIKVESLSRAEEMLGGIIGEGREMFKEELQAAHAKYNEQFSKVFKDVTGRDVDVNDPDVVNEINEATDDLKRSAEATKANDNKVVKFIKSLNPKNIFVKSETIEGLMERIAEAPGVLLGGNARKLVYEGLNEGIRGYKKRMMETKKAVSGKMKEIYGKKWRKINKDNSVKQVVEGIYTNPEAVKKAQDQYDANPTRKNKKNLQRVKGEKAITLSKNQVGYLYMQMKDPANVPAFENMKSLLGEDYKRTMDELVEWAGKDVVAMAEWQMNEFYPSMYPEINEAYKNIYRTDLPWNENYGGRMYREGEVIQPLDLLGEKGRSPQANSQVAAASTKMRQARSKPIMPVDMMNALVTYSQDMQWFANVGPTIRDINKLFTNPLMRKAITNAKGEVTMDMIDHAIKNIANRGLQTERGNDFVNSMNNLFATTRLGISPNIAIKQLTSIPTYALDIGAGNYLYYAVKNKTEFLKVFNEIRENSVYLQDRLSTDIRQSIEAYSAKGLDGSDPASGVFTKGAGSFFTNLMMGFVKAGDITAIYLGGMPNYSYYKAEFMRENPQATPQEAIDYAVRKFESDTKSTQQSMDVTDKDYFQTSSPFNRALNMFKTSPKQYLRKEMSGLRNMRRGFRDKNLKQFAGGLNKFLMYHVMMPVGFQFVAAGMGLAGWDEEDNKDIARAAILGNFNSLFLVGDILQGLSNTLAGRTYGKDVGTLPVFDAFGEINEQYLKWNRLKDPEKKEEAFIRMTTRIGELALAGRIPLYNITRFYKNIEKAASASDTQEAILRLLNYSDYVIEGNERDTQSAPKTREERDAERDTETSRKKREEEKRRKDRDKRGRR